MWSRKGERWSSSRTDDVDENAGDATRGMAEVEEEEARLHWLMAVNTGCVGKCGWGGCQ